jgi:hypothetical protein
VKKLYDNINSSLNQLKIETNTMKEIEISKSEDILKELKGLLGYEETFVAQCQECMQTQKNTN